MSSYNSEDEVTKLNASILPPIALGIDVDKPKFPQYAVYSKRLESFEEWPEAHPMDKKDLVEAGLVYTGVEDIVTCFFCGGELRNWEQGDVPMEEHAKRYTNCLHIMLAKGQAYVERLARGEKPEDPGKSSEQDSVDAVDYTNNVAAQSCIEMGYSEQMVRKAIDVFMERNGNTDFKGADLCEILFDIEEHPERFDERSIYTEDVNHAADKRETSSFGEEQYGEGDSERFYFRGGGLRNWEQGDSPTEAKDNADVVNYTKIVAAQSCIEMGYSEQMVKKAISIFIERNGSKDYEGADLCLILFDIEENPDIFCTRSVCTEDEQVHFVTPSVGEEQYEP